MAGPGDSYGDHLKDIVEAFIKVSKYELAEGEIVSNYPKRAPRQAFRIEITNKFALSGPALRYFHGLIRWHVFLQDWRGKSVKGMITPRLYLNRVLIPFGGLTFSSHDNIALKNDEFCMFLTEPRSFYSYWRRKRRKSANERAG